MEKTCAGILLFLFACRLASQTPATVSFLTVNDGLSQGMSFDLLQSRDGFLWIATKDGLNRYDGSRFEVFSPDPFDPFAIRGSEVRALFEDSRGWIWVSLFDEGLDVLDPSSGRFFHVKHKDNTFYTENIAETPDGSIWFTYDNTVWKVSIEKDMLEKAAEQGNAIIEPPYKAIAISPISAWPDGTEGVSSLLFTQKQKLLVGTNQGVCRVDISTGQVLPELPIPDCLVLWMTESKSGELLIKGDQLERPQLWVRIVDGEIQYTEDLRSGYSRSRFIYDDEGCFWVFRDGGLQKWRPSAFFDHGRPEMEIGADKLRVNKGYAGTALLVDKSGIVWAGTDGYGIVKINEKGQKFRTVLPGISHRLILEDPAGGFYTSWFPDKKFLSKNFDRSIPNSEATLARYQTGGKIVAFDPAGNTWNLEGWYPAGGGTILSRIDAVTKTKKTFPFEGITLLCDRNGKIVSVNEKGLHRFDPATETSRLFPFEKPQKRLSENAHFLYEDSEGAIWIFGFMGLVKAVPDKSEYRFEQYGNDPADRSSLSINTVLSVADDPLEPRRYLWVGTKGGGLNRLDKASGTFRHFTKAEGLPDNVVYGILTQDRPGGSQSPGYLWMSTNKGLCRFDVRAETTKNFTVADGLQDNEFNSGSYLKTRDGSLIFGGVNGLNVFHPDSLHFNENVPQVHIVGLKVNNRPISDFGFRISGLSGTHSAIRNPHSAIVLSHDQNLLNFDFAALEFTNPSQNQYRYQLVGVDEDWVALGAKNSIQFANLAPGDYTFKVDGSNNDGVWSEHPAELRFTIRPPWWARWWAFALYLAMGLSAIGLFYRYRLRQKLKHQETLRLREMDDFKSRFFTNITHEFRTPLTVILGMGEQLAKEETDVQKKGMLGLIKRNGESLLRLISQLLDLAKLESKALKINNIQGDVLTYLKYIAESLHSLANAQNVLLRVESKKREIVMDYDPERFLQVIHNLLSNAIKFTPSGGKVMLRVDVQDNWLHISVTDSGVGIPEDELPHLFERFFQAKNQEHAKAGGTGIGLSLAAELVRAMGGSISVESTVGVGSTFLVKLPVTNTSAFTEKTPNMEPEGWESSTATLPVRTTSDPHDSDSSLPQILLIEDNPDVVEYLTACLQNPGDRNTGDHEGRPYRLDFAYNGMAGIEHALASVPDLIVSDVMMPIKDGFEVLETLKKDARTSHIPIILLTAKADVQSRLAGLRRGADAYLSKPFNQEELLVTVENLLELRRKLQEKYGQLDIQKIEVDETENSADPEDIFLQKFRTLVAANLSDTDYEMVHLERALAMSRSQIYRKVKALTGKSPSLFIRSIRLHHGRHLLLSTTLTVSEIAYEVGYAALNNFSDAFVEEFGERPGKVRG